MQPIEIYPKIVVYKNLFNNIENIYNIIENSDDDAPNRFFSKWSKWSTFGKYLQPISTKVNWDEYKIEDGIAHIKEDFDVDQKNVVVEIMNAFNAASEDYFNRYDLDIDLSKDIVGHDGNIYKMWRRVAPVICRYDMLSYENRKMTMRYHSDYIREPMSSPGYKFAVTALCYFNDNYEGGEIDFAIGNKTVKYKPEAGDFLIFPSGNPDFLTEDGNVYIHGVHPVKSGANKLFLRMFWQHYNVASQDWIEKENALGRELWEKEYREMSIKFSQDGFQRSTIPNAIVIEPKIN